MSNQIVVRKAHVKGVHRDSFRPGESGKVEGFVLVENPSLQAPTPCLEVLYSDGVRVLIPLHLIKENEGAYVISCSEID